MQNWDDIMPALNRYGIRVVRGSFKCPKHNDTHLGNVKIYKNHGAFCFACQQHISSTDIVMINEGWSYGKAVEYVWCDLWGRQLPEYEQHGKNKNYLNITYDDMKTIGLPGAFDCTVTFVVNKCDWQDDVEGKVKQSRDDNNLCDVEKTVQMDSLYTMLTNHDEGAFLIVKGKALELRAYATQCLKECNDKSTQLGSMFQWDRNLRKEMIDDFQKQLNVANKVLHEIDNYQKKSG